MVSRMTVMVLCRPNCSFSMTVYIETCKKATAYVFWLMLHFMCIFEKVTFVAYLGLRVKIQFAPLYS